MKYTTLPARSMSIDHQPASATDTSINVNVNVNVMVIDIKPQNCPNVAVLPDAGEGSDHTQAQQQQTSSTASIVKDAHDQKIQKASTSTFHILPDIVAVGIFCLIAGAIDTASFLSLHQIFTAHVTGNVVIACTLIVQNGVENNTSDFVRLIFIPVFMAGAATSDAISLLCELYQPTNHQQSITPLPSLTLNFIMHLILWIVGVEFRDQLIASTSLLDLHVLVVACIASFAMGHQMAFCGRYLSPFPNTNAITVSIRVFTLAATHVLLLDGIFREKYHEVQQSLPSEPSDKDVCSKWLHSFIAVATFSMGCIVGAVTVHYISWNVAGITSGLIGILVMDLSVGKMILTMHIS